MTEEPQGFKISANTTQELSVIPAPRLMYQIDKPDWDIAIDDLREAKKIQSRWWFRHIQFFTTAFFAASCNALLHLHDALAKFDGNNKQEISDCLWPIILPLSGFVICFYFQIKMQTDATHHIKKSLNTLEKKTHRDE